VLRYRLITGPLLVLGVLLLVWIDETFTGSGHIIGGANGLSGPHPLGGPGGAPSVGPFEGIAEGNLPRGAIIIALGLCIAPLMARETSTMLVHVGVEARAWLGMLAATLAYAVTVALPGLEPGIAAGLAASCLVLILIAGLVTFSRGHNVHGVMSATGGLLLVTVYAGVLLAFWPLIRHEHSAWVLLGAILTTKSCDTGAYFTGMACGRHKLIEWLSPKKTWEGLIGGVLTATMVGMLLAWASSSLPAERDHIPMWLGGLGGCLIGIVGQAGDLAESLFKRDAGMKDSGRILPGMGGVLDVLDSPLLTGPVVFWLLRIVG
jgi:phosphatidate cytidylyltransferase